MRACVAIVLSVLFAVVAQAGVEAGFVEDYDGAASGYQLLRNARPIPVALLTPIQPGDRIEVSRADGRIRLRLGSAQAITLTQGDGPFVVGPAAEEATVLGNVARWALALTQPGNGASKNRVSLTTRSAGLVIPLCPPGAVQRLPRTVPFLTIEWRGGAAPVRARLLQGELALAEQALAASPGVLPVAAEIAGGAARLELVDAFGRRAEVALEFVEGATPDVSAGTDPGFASLLAAYETIERDGSAGHLAAYQQLVSVADVYPPAAALAEALARGDTP